MALFDCWWAQLCIQRQMSSPVSDQRILLYFLLPPIYIYKFRLFKNHQANICSIFCKTNTYKSFKTILLLMILNLLTFAVFLSVSYIFLLWSVLFNAFFFVFNGSVLSPKRNVTATFCFVWPWSHQQKWHGCGFFLHLVSDGHRLWRKRWTEPSIVFLTKPLSTRLWPAHCHTRPLL